MLAEVMPASRCHGHIGDSALQPGPLLPPTPLSSLQQVRAALRRQHRAACVIQAQWRAHASQKRYQQVLHLVVKLQGGMRGWLARHQLQQRHAAASAIQVRDHVLM